MKTRQITIIVLILILLSSFVSAAGVSTAANSATAVSNYKYDSELGLYYTEIGYSSDTYDYTTKKLYYEKQRDNSYLQRAVKYDSEQDDWVIDSYTTSSGAVQSYVGYGETYDPYDSNDGDVYGTSGGASKASSTFTSGFNSVVITSGTNKNVQVTSASNTDSSNTVNSGSSENVKAMPLVDQETEEVVTLPAGVISISSDELNLPNVGNVQGVELISVDSSSGKIYSSDGQLIIGANYDSSTGNVNIPSGTISIGGTDSKSQQIANYNAVVSQGNNQQVIQNQMNSEFIATIIKSVFEGMSKINLQQNVQTISQGNAQQSDPVGDVIKTEIPSTKSGLDYINDELLRKSGAIAVSSNPTQKDAIEKLGEALRDAISKGDKSVEEVRQQILLDKTTQYGSSGKTAAQLLGQSTVDTINGLLLQNEYKNIGLEDAQKELETFNPNYKDNAALKAARQILEKAINPGGLTNDQIADNGWKVTETTVGGTTSITYSTKDGDIGYTALPGSNEFKINSKYGGVYSDNFKYDAKKGFVTSNGDGVFVQNMGMVRYDEGINTKTAKKDTPLAEGYYKTADGKQIALDGRRAYKTNAEGELVRDTDNDHKLKYDWANFFTFGSAGWSTNLNEFLDDYLPDAATFGSRLEGIGNAFKWNKGDFYNEWVDFVDNAFAKYLGVEYWSSEFCKGTQIKSTPSNTLTIIGPSGLPQIAGFVEAARSEPYYWTNGTHEGQEYLYRISFGMENPTYISENDEAEESDNVKFNIQLSGESGTISLYPHDIVLEPGESLRRVAHAAEVGFLEEEYDTVKLIISQAPEDSFDDDKILSGGGVLTATISTTPMDTGSYSDQGLIDDAADYGSEEEEVEAPETSVDSQSQSSVLGGSRG